MSMVFWVARVISSSTTGIQKGEEAGLFGECLSVGIYTEMQNI